MYVYANVGFCIYLFHMTKNSIWYTTNIFDYGEYYSKNGDNKLLRWISRKYEIYIIVMKNM